MLGHISCIINTSLTRSESRIWNNLCPFVIQTGVLHAALGLTHEMCGFGDIVTKKDWKLPKKDTSWALNSFSINIKFKKFWKPCVFLLTGLCNLTWSKLIWWQNTNWMWGSFGFYFSYWSKYLHVMLQKY